MSSQGEWYDCRLTATDGKRFLANGRFWILAWPMVHRLTTLMNWPDWQDFEV